MAPPQEEPTTELKADCSGNLLGWGRLDRFPSDDWTGKWEVLFEYPDRSLVTKIYTGIPDYADLLQSCELANHPSVDGRDWQLWLDKMSLGNANAYEVLCNAVASRSPLAPRRVVIKVRLAEQMLAEEASSSSSLAPQVTTLASIPTWKWLTFGAVAVLGGIALAFGARCAYRSLASEGGFAGWGRKHGLQRADSLQLTLQRFLKIQDHVHKEFSKGSDSGCTTGAVPSSFFEETLLKLHHNESES